MVVDFVATLLDLLSSAREPRRSPAKAIDSPNTVNLDPSQWTENPKEPLPHEGHNREHNQNREPD